MLDFKHIASTVRAERARKDWTQIELARRMDRHVNTIIKAEDGRPVSRNTIGRMERALGMDAGTLIVHTPTPRRAKDRRGV